VLRHDGALWTRSWHAYALFEQHAKSFHGETQAAYFRPRRELHTQQHMHACHYSKAACMKGAASFHGKRRRHTSDRTRSCTHNSKSSICIHCKHFCYARVELCLGFSCVCKQLSLVHFIALYAFQFKLIMPGTVPMYHAWACVWLQTLVLLHPDSSATRSSTRCGLQAGMEGRVGGLGLPGCRGAALHVGLSMPESDALLL
jgi:hypothetical protein